MKNRICTILGGGGFIGRYLVRNLTKKNYRCIITTRNTFQKGYLKTQAPPGAVELIACLLYTSPSPRDLVLSRMPSSA